MKSLLSTLLLVLVAVTGCQDATTLTAPEPCADYELVSMYDGEAVFERDVSIRLDVSDYEGELITGNTYTLCGQGQPGAYIK